MLLLLGLHIALSAFLLILGEAIRAVDRGHLPELSRQKLAQVAREWAAYFLVPLSWLMALLPQPGLSRCDDSAPPIIMVPGYGLNRGSLWGMATYLRRISGRTVLVVNNRPISAPVPVYARQLSHTIDDVLQQTGATKVDLVGHSMGGIIAAWAVNRMESAPHVRRLVTLGSPWKGTRYAVLGPFLQTKDLRPGAAVIEDIQNPAVPVTAIWSDADHMLIPLENGTTEGIENVELDMVGHMDMLMNIHTYQTVAKVLAGDTSGGSTD